MYNEMRRRYPSLPSNYVVTACRHAAMRVKSFLAAKRRGRSYTDKPQIKRVAVRLSKELWKSEGRTAVRVATERGWVTIGLRSHKQFWRYANGGWALRPETRLKLNHRRRNVYFYLLRESRQALRAERLPPRRREREQRNCAGGRRCLPA